jgi:drug/metabolite transporter (DMT)-like permease
LKIEKSELRLHAALFTVALLFSANYVISKLGMREFSPLAFAWLRIAGAALILAASCAMSRRCRATMRGASPASQSSAW